MPVDLTLRSVAPVPVSSGWRRAGQGLSAEPATLRIFLPGAYLGHTRTGHHETSTPTRVLQYLMVLLVSGY